MWLFLFCNNGCVVWTTAVEPMWERRVLTQTVLVVTHKVIVHLTSMTIRKSDDSYSIITGTFTMRHDIFIFQDCQNRKVVPK